MNVADPARRADAGSLPDGELRTARLRLRPMTDADLPAFVAYRRDPGVARYQSWDETFSHRDAVALFASRRGIEIGAPGAWTQIAIEEAASGTLIGDVALHVRADDPLQAEIGFTLASGHQGHGFGTEAVSAVLDYAFGTLALHRVFAVTDARNDAAARLLERVGFRREGHYLKNVWFKGAWGDEFSFAILHDEWLG
jgi:ribosomal-protein-alanine N-acetyltransferase